MLFVHITAVEYIPVHYTIVAKADPVSKDKGLFTPSELTDEVMTSIEATVL